MEKTIKYLENGEYHYATVKDVGDLAKLKTDSKDDLVTAINELFITGGEGPKKPDGYDELVDNVADAIQKQQQMTDTITNMQQSAQLSDAEMQHMKQVQEEAHQDYIKALKEFNDAIAQANADALELDKKTDELKKNADDLNKKTNDLQDKLNETFTNVGNEVSAVHKQLDTESAGLHKELNDTKASLEETRKDLLNNTQEFGVVNSEVKELKDKMDRRIWSTDLDPVREQVNKNTTEVSQTKDELKNKADQSNLDLVTNSVENLSTQVKENAAGLKVSVKKDELGGDVARLLNDKTNLLLGTRNFSGNNWLNKNYWHEEPGYWNGLKVYSTEEQYYGIQYQYYVKAGNTYTFSLWAKQNVENTRAAFYLLAENKDGIVDPLRKDNVLVKTDWTRVCITFEAIQDAFIYPRLEQTVTKNKLYIAGYKLELGSVATPWEPNEADVAENIEHNESQFNVYSDQIAGIVKKQEKMGDTERQLDTRITETAEGLKQTSKDLQDANGKITEFKGQLESTARGLKTEYEKYTNDAIGQISDSSLNLIRNSSFSNGEDELASWQNVSAKATVKEDNNNLHWIELTQTGQSTDNPIGITSNYFIVKQGKVTVAVDIKLGDKANLDNQNILLLELYNDNKQRVDFTDVSVSQLGLSTTILNDHNVHRGLYRLEIDRKDVKYMTVKAILHRNGDLWLTNFSARLSSIDDGGYTPNPDDVNQQILKQNTKIEQDAKQIALKANSVDVTRDIKSAVQNSNGGGINLIKKSSFHNMTIDQVGNAWSIGQGVSINPKGGTGSAGSIIIDAQNIVDSNSYMEITQSIDVEPNTDYTFSLRLLWGKAASGKSFNAYTFMVEHTSDGGTTSPYQDNNRHIANSPSRSANTYTVHTSANTHSLLLYIRAMGGSYIELEEVKLERGPVATPWTPNSQDTSEEIKSAKDAAIQVASDQINLHVNELSTQFDDKLNKRVNEVKTASEKFTSDGIEQVVTKVTDVKNDVNNVNSKLDNLQVGGRNLLHGTSDQWKTLNDNGNGWLQKTTASTCWTSTADYHTGNTFTYAAKITNNSHQQAELEIWLCDQNKNLINGQTFHAPIPKGANAYDVSVTFPITVNTWYIRSWIIFTGGNAPNGDSVQVKDERLVEGNLAGAWSPNPDDINQKIDSVKTETTASVNNLGDRVTTEVNSVTKKINSNNGGGVNLLTRSSFRNMTLEEIKKSWSVTSYAWVNDKKSIVIDFKNGTGTVADITQTVDLEPDTDYTLSLQLLYAEVASGKSWGFQTYLVEQDENGKAVSPYKDNGLMMQNSNSRAANTRLIHTSNATHKGVLYIRAFPGTQVEFKDVKLERGNIATPWSDSPEDLTNAISEVNTKWDVANGQIQGKVTETDVNNILNGKGYATQSWAQSEFRMKSDSIELEVKKITDPISNKINNLQVGGRNLLANSSDDISVTSHTTDGYPAWANIDTGFSFEHGKTYTFSAEARNSTDKITEASIRVFEYSTNTQVGIYAFPADGKRHSITFSIPNDSHDYHLLLYAGHAGIVPGVNVTTTYHHPKLEEGNVATDWTPAPEDTTAEIKSAKDTAINVANDKVNASSKELQGKIDDSNKELQGIKDITQWHTVSGPIDLNDLKTQTRIFYRDIQDKNSAVTGWQYIVVDSSSDKVTQTVWKDNSTIQYIRQFTGAWSNWVRQTNQNDIDEAKTGLREEIKSAKDAAIQVASDQINIHVNELTTSFDDKLNKRVNEVKTASEKFTSDGIEQTVRKITDVKNQVDGLCVGGRNLLHGTSDKYRTLSGTGWLQKTTASDPYTSVANYHGGDWFTYAATVTNPTKHSVQLEIELRNQDKAFIQSKQSIIIPAGAQNYRTFVNTQIDANTWFVNTWLIFPNASGVTGDSVQVKDERLVEGNMAGTWSPNPEDVDKKIETQTLDSANIDQMKTQGHYFVHNLTGNPIGGWVYVDVMGVDGRIRQDVYQDNGSKHMSRKLFGNSWSGWEQGAYLSDVNNTKTEVTASVKNLGDRVTTEVNSITTKVNSNNGGGVNLQTGTGDCSFPFTANQGQAVVEKYDDHTKMIHAYGSASGFYIGFGNGTFIPDVGAKYTISADIKGKGTIDGNGFKYEGSDSVSTNKVTLSNNWQRISCTVHVSQHTGTWIFYPVPGSGNNDFYVKHIKIERGSVATPWSPAPEDTTDVIKTLSTKWDVANGQIQGKVTATDVNNILNGKGYATQSWAQTMFTMKSDAITLQAVRDNITNGIQNQVNDTRNQVKGLQNQFNTQTGINLLKGTADFSGSWFNKDANGWSIMSGWQAPFSENTSAMNNNVVYVKNGSAWNGLGQAVQLNPGEYTFSMWLWPDLSGKESLSIYAGDGQYGGTATLSCGYTYSASQPQKQWVLAKLYLNVTKGGVVAIRPELNQDTGKMYVASYMLQRGHVENPTWAPNPGDLSPSNIVSAINLTPDDIKLASKKINIDGNTSISGTLNVPTVRLQGKSGQIDLSGDSGISIKDSSGGKVDIGASGVNIFSGMQTVNTDFADKSGFKLNVGSSGVEFSNVLHQTNGIMGAGQHEYGFLKIEPAVLPGTNTQETQYNAPAGIIGYVENMPDASLGPMSPGGFLALGSRTRKDTNVNSPVEDKTEIVYANKALNGWDQGLTIRSQFFIKPQDADHGIRSAWVSWSAWDHGEKYPAFVNDSGAWGGICFPRSGRVTLFDSGGQYYTPDRSTGVGPYDNYWTKGQ